MRHRAQNLKHKTQSAKKILCSLLFALCLLLSSCFKEKTIAPPANTGHGQTVVIEMTPDYTDQFFYSLSTNSVISHNSRFAYDLMFDCAAGKFNIWLNTAKFMSVKRTNVSDLDSVQLSDTLSGKWHYEFGAFNPDSNAIGKWWNQDSLNPTSTGNVYLIRLGVDNVGNPFGFIKMKVNNFSGNSYSITYSDFSSPSKTIIIPKNDAYNYAYLSVAGNGTLLNTVEPPKNTWDLCFTRYSIFFYAPYNIPYLVTGVLHNPSRTQAYMDSTLLVFDSINIGSFDEGRLLTKRDAIGYEWKRYTTPGFEGGGYEINLHYTYYIKVDDDKFYKLRFFAFDKFGIRGYPSFEYFQF